MTLRLMLPHPPTNADELQAVLDLARHLSANGQTVILGEKRCFICGTELGSLVPDAPIKRIGGRTIKIFVRLCDSCFGRF